MINNLRKVRRFNFSLFAHTDVNMKKFILIITAILTLILLSLPSSCNVQETGSLKSITHPYIAHYECTDARLGNLNLLEKYDYIEIILVNKEDIEIVLKPKNGDKQILKSKYTFDNETHELSSDIGILGYRFKQSTKIEKGKFTISKEIGGKQLIMNFICK